MSKYLTIIASVAAIASLITISSCKEDEPPAKPVISFKVPDRSVPEGSGTLAVEIELSAPAPSDLTLEYNLAGTAMDLEDAPNVASADYSIENGSGELEIEKGATSATINIVIVADGAYEENETIELDLDDAGTDATISDEDGSMVVTIINDDEKPLVSFSGSSMTVNESDGIIEIPVTLGTAATQDLTIQYTLTAGNPGAMDSVTSANTPIETRIPADYAIKGGTPGSFSIKKNATQGVIRVGIYSDFYFELTEAMTITLTSGTSVDVGTNPSMTVNIEQQDGLVAELYWEHADVDMDMFLWIGDAENEKQIIALSIANSTEAPEQIFIPGILRDGLEFGMSYVYYGGTADPMNFSVLFAEFIDGAPEPESGFVTYDGTYTIANKNPWATIDEVTQIEQTFEKVGEEFVNFTEIITPTTGSRVPQKRSTQKLLTEFKKTNKSLIQRRIGQ